MLKILKNLKESTLSVILIVLLLCIQAAADLKLPSFTSDIVNVGIQQGGIENVAPEVISDSTLQNVLYFTDKDDEIMQDYSVLNENDSIRKKYNVTINERVYKLNDISKKELANLNSILAKPLLMLEMTTNDEMANTIKSQIISNYKEQMEKMLTAVASDDYSATDKIKNSNQTLSNIPMTNLDLKNKIDEMNQMSLMELLKSMPQESSTQVISKFNEQLDAMSDSIIKQGAITQTKAEYTKLGIDTSDFSTQYIIKTGLLMLFVALISMASAILIILFSSRVAAQLGKTLREKVFKKVLKFSTAEFNKFSTASLITRSTNDIQQIQQLMTMLFRVVIYAPIMGIGGIIMVATTSNLSMIWIIAMAIAVIIIVVITLFATTMKKFEKMQTLLDKLNLVAREILTGIPVIRAFNTQKREESRFDKANKDLYSNSVFVNNVMSLMMPGMMFVMQSVMLLIIWFGGKDIDQGIIQVGDMMAFIQYTMQILISFLMISIISIMLPRASISANRINEVLDNDISIKDKPKKDQTKFDDMKKGLVEFRNVSFKYPDADADILTDITFTAEPGKTTAIIGSTGSGKSTVINLIPRFYDVTKGELLVDGANVKDVSQKDLRSRIGFVPQKGILFSGTIESNIKYGTRNIENDSKATKEKFDSDNELDSDKNEDFNKKERFNITNVQMEEAASIAQATEFIDKKDEKYESEIAQGGNNVSGGQKQRLSIARALAINPEIFIFDDSFSALDLKTDKRLREDLKKKTTNKTVIIVAQRISTIIDAEQIIVLEEGKIVGKGTHQELLENCETYKQIALSQLTQEELERKEM